MTPAMEGALNKTLKDLDSLLDHQENAHPRAKLVVSTRVSYRKEVRRVQRCTAPL